MITGPGAVNSIGATVLKYGKAAFIVSDPGVSKAGLVAQLRGHLEAAGLPVLPPPPLPSPLSPALPPLPPLPSPLLP